LREENPALHQKGTRSFIICVGIGKRLGNRRRQLIGASEVGRNADVEVPPFVAHGNGNIDGTGVETGGSFETDAVDSRDGLHALVEAVAHLVLFHKHVQKQISVLPFWELPNKFYHDIDVLISWNICQNHPGRYQLLHVESFSMNTSGYLPTLKQGNSGYFPVMIFIILIFISQMVKGDKKMKALYWLSVLGTLILIDCSGSKISVTQAPDAEFKPIQRLAIMLDSGVLGDAIAKELLNRGLNTITEDETVAMVGGIRINQIGVSAREYYAALREKGVDAMLTASARMAQDGKPDRASAQILDTASGDSLMDIAWQNAWGEMADQMRIASCEKALLKKLF